MQRVVSGLIRVVHRRITQEAFQDWGHGWQAEAGQNGYIFYTSSADGGATFSEPLLVASTDGTDGRGRFTNSDLVLGPDGRIYLAWVDNLGVHLAIWQS